MTHGTMAFGRSYHVASLTLNTLN